MKTLATILMLTFLMRAFTTETDFLIQQKKYERVRSSFEEKEKVIIQNLDEKGLKLDNLHILFVAYKDKDELDMYAKNKMQTAYKKLTTYRICARSGLLGPKRKQGDYQVPEGFYYIDRFNPTSNFYLSLGLNYPNLSDKLKSKASDVGGDIFIHVSCATRQ
jgi:murein L,D-transpeptidase YafK